MRTAPTAAAAEPPPGAPVERPGEGSGAGARARRSALAEASWQATLTGVVMALVGFASTFVIVLQGLAAVGATEVQAATGLGVCLIACGLSGMWLSWTRRMPLPAAWSAPGAALLIVSGASATSFEAAVGAFVVCGLLLVAAGAIRPVGRLMESIPSSLANAMLAGILLTLCLAPVRALGEELALAAPLLLAWWAVGRFSRPAAVPVALLVLAALVYFRLGVPEGYGRALLASLVPDFAPVVPRFDAATLLGIALPLFVVTMASQNLPGIAVQRANGYVAPAGPQVVNTGVFSTLAAPFGSHAVNLAAITAAMAAGPDCHPDPERRWWAAFVAGACYVLIGTLAGALVMLVSAVPPVLVEAVAGLALLGAFTGAAVAAFRDPAEREAAAVTFLFSASGLAFLGIGGAFWGLLAGVGMHAVAARQAARRAGREAASADRADRSGAGPPTE